MKKMLNGLELMAMASQGWMTKRRLRTLGSQISIPQIPYCLMIGSFLLLLTKKETYG